MANKKMYQRSKSVMFNLSLSKDQFSSGYYFACNFLKDLSCEISSRSKKITTIKRSCVDNCLCTRLGRLLNPVLIIEPIFVDKVKNLKENKIRNLANNFLDFHTGKYRTNGSNLQLINKTKLLITVFVFIF